MTAALPDKLAEALKSSEAYECAVGAAYNDGWRWAESEDEEATYNEVANSIVDTLLPAIREHFAAAWDDGWEAGTRYDRDNPWREDADA